MSIYNFDFFHTFELRWLAIFCSLNPTTVQCQNSEKKFCYCFFHQKQSDLFIKSRKYFRNNLITLWVSEKIANRFWWFNFSYLETDIPPKDKKLWYIFVGSKKKQYISHIKLNCNWMMMCFHKIFHLYFYFYDFSKLWKIYCT